MPIYPYTIKTSKGGETSGTVEANDEADAKTAVIEMLRPEDRKTPTVKKSEVEIGEPQAPVAEETEEQENV